MPVPPSPEEMQAALAEWGVWIEKFMKAGNILDPGDGLKECGKVLRQGGTAVTDGPFLETKEFMGGFYLVDCENKERAVELATRIPDTRFDGFAVEVRPVMFSAGLDM